MNIIGLIFIIASLAAFVYLKIKMPVIKGKIGEKSVSITLSVLPKDEYIILNDLMLRDGSRTTQIDHIVISVHGIFVIETKNYKGWIFGNSNRDYWTQNIWGNKYSFYNPISQNQSHIRFLKKKFDIIREKEIYIYPIVVFLHASKLHLTGDCECVLWRDELDTFIKSHRQNVLTFDECTSIASSLANNNVTIQKERAGHKANVNAAKLYHDNCIHNGFCPFCGGKLIHRTGKYGDFYGCSNYPECRYTRK